MTLEDLTEYFDFLDDLRESGQTNMLGGAVYLRENFPLDRKEASAVLHAWLKTFDARPAPDRAMEAFEAMP